MAVSTLVYAHGIDHVAQGDIIWKAAGGSAMRIGLVLNSYTPDKDADDFRDDVAQGGGAGNHEGIDITLANPSIGTDLVDFAGSDADYTFTGMSGSQTYGGCVIYKTVGTAGTDNLLCLDAFSGGTIDSIDDTPIVVTPNASGLWKVTV